MSAPRADWSQLNALLERDSASTQTLLTLLESERSSLEKRDYDTLTTLLAQKQTLIAELEGRARDRQRFITQYGFDTEGALLSAARQQAPKVADRWIALGNLWQRCQELNLINQQIVERSQFVVSRLLNILQAGGDQSTVYNTDGNRVSSTGGRSITSA